MADIPSGLKLVNSYTSFKPGDFAVARSSKINKVTNRADLNLVEIIKFDRTFNAYKVLEAGGKEGFYSPTQLQYADNDPIVTRSYYEILNLRKQVEDITIKFDSYKSRSFLQRIKDFFMGAK